MLRPKDDIVAMPIHFLFPADALNANSVEELFAEQAQQLNEAGFTTSLMTDAVVDDGAALRRIPRGATVVYRGWMLKAAQYAKLVAAIEQAEARPFTRLDEYLATHHLPNWYPRIAAFTPETRIFPPDIDLETALRSLAWDAYFIKDYVKSLKTSMGSLVKNPADAGRVVKEMREFRGEIEGGLCVRRYVTFQAAAERRYFVLNGCPFGSDHLPMPSIVAEVAARIHSPFFSVDIAPLEDGTWNVVEVGDGQVTDLVGWSPQAFVRMWTTCYPISTESEFRD